MQMLGLYFFLMAFCACSRHSPHTPAPVQDAAVWGKIRFDLNALDAEGLSTTPGGRVSVHYEFCIPTDERHWKQVQAIDSTAQRYPDSSGRVGCGGGTCLIIGTTQQQNYRKVLYDLAALPFVDRIEQTFWE